MPQDPDNPFTVDPDELTADEGPLLLRCANLYKRTRRAALAAAGVSPTQEQVLHLLTLIRPDKAPRSVDLAHALRLNPILIAHLMRLFESRGWLSRRPDPRDGRANLVALTEEGLRKAQEVRGALDKTLGHFFDPLGQEVKGFRRLLTALLRTHDPVREAVKSVRARRKERKSRQKP